MVSLPRPVTRKQKSLLTLAVILGVVSALVALALPPRREQLTTRPDRAMSNVVAGVSHVHTTRSDGTGTPDEIAEAAARAGLQFVIFTDHGDGTRTPDPPQYRHGVLCLDAVEISTADGHYIGVGMPASPYPLGGEARDVVEDVDRLGGFGIVAHPDSMKGALQWREWMAPAPAIEWLNADTEWRDETYAKLARALATYPIRPAESLASLLNRPDTTLRRWDEMTRRQHVVALPGSDAHARLGWGNEVADPYRNRVLLRLPSYVNMLSTFSMRVELDEPLSRDPAADSARLLDALRRGRVYSVVDGFAGPAQFDFLVRSGESKARQGESLEPAGPLVVEVFANGPPGSSIVILRDGRLTAQGPGPQLRHEVAEPGGVWRAEVRLDALGRQATPWLVSNPVYVGLSTPQPTARPAPTTTRRLDEPEAERRWHVEHQSGSSGILERSNNGPVTFRFTLVPDILTQSVAMVLPEGAALWEFDRISFRAKATSEMRISVQLRQPAGRDGHRWRRSVYLDNVVRDITVMFADMRPVAETGGLKPDMGKIEDLLFVVDTTNTRPGVTGAVTFEALALQR